MSQEEEIRAKLQEYQSLVKSQAWAGLVNLGNEQLEVRRNLLNDLKVKDIEGIADFNYAQGEIAAIKLFLSFPEILIEHAKEVIEDEDYDEEDGSSDE